ncbi:hypothetical protein BJ875DRAFT_470349 [Amylocarpus encephaloides]|uniref:Uncharacterized protein n=1 Tax=Amylocarpus encephaloides TaxID=45428 RepID=A0A9P8C269_9HELO|nr:hypothetical protein BJ875DRAFT_470349 [Amylocarpus encephaloides]
MKLSHGALVASWLLPALAAPVEIVPVDVKPTVIYESPNLNLDKSGMTVLKPVVGSGDLFKARPSPGSFKDFKLKKEITLSWKNDEVLANATLRANWNGAPNMKVINMEDFGDALEGVDCTAPYMYLDFKIKDTDLFNSVMKEWGWVNDKTENQIVLFANHKSCGPDATREPYMVKSIQYDLKLLKALLKVEPVKDFEAIVYDGEFEYTTLVDPNDEIPPSFYDAETVWDPAFDSPPITKRDVAISHPVSRIDVSKTLNLNHNFNGNIFSFGDSDANLRLDCVDCRTRGYVTAQGYIKFGFFRIEKAYVEFRASQVQAVMNLKLQAHLEREVKDHKIVLPLTAFIGIPKLAAVRMGVDIGIGWDMNFSATGVMTFGVTATMAQSKYRNCFKGCSDVKSGWNWSLSKNGPEFEGDITARIGLHLLVNPKVAAEIVGFGYEGGVAFLAPKFQGDVSFQGNTQGGICGDPLVTAGIDVDLAYGYEGYVYAGQNYQNTDFQSPIFPPHMSTFFDECYPLKKMDGVPSPRATKLCEQFRTFATEREKIGANQQATLTACEAQDWDAAEKACKGINTRVLSTFSKRFSLPFISLAPTAVCGVFKL